MMSRQFSMEIRRAIESSRISLTGKSPSVYSARFRLAESWFREHGIWCNPFVVFSLPALLR
jgi:hypothetical protein